MVFQKGNQLHKLRRKIGGLQTREKNSDEYTALHYWIKNRLIKPQTCRSCNQPKPLDLANISGEYKRDLSDWEWLCRNCHMIKDGRLAKLHELQKGRVWTKEHKNKISNSLKGRIPWNKGLRKSRVATS